MTPSAKRSEPRYIWLRLAVLIGALAAVLALSGWLGVERLGVAHLLAVLAVQPLNLLALICVGLRLTVLSGGAAPLWPAVKASALSGTLLYILPSRLSELVKPIYLSTQCNVTMLRGLAIVAVERSLDVLIVAVVGLAGAALFARAGSSPAVWWWSVAATVAMAGGGLLLWKHSFFRALINLVPLARLRTTLIRLLDDLVASMSPSRLLLGLLAGIAAWACSFAMVYILLQMTASVPLSLQDALLVFLAGTIGIAVAVAPGGVGTFEAGMVLALKYHGIGTGEAIMLALLSRIANLGLVPFIAIWAAVMDGVGVGKLVEAARRASRSTPEIDAGAQREAGVPSGNGGTGG